MHFVFYNTNDVFVAEEKLQSASIKTEIVPTPVQDKAYCGVCVRINDDDIEVSEQVISDMEYIKI